MSDLLLILTILLSAGRNVFSKGMTDVARETNAFFGQMLLFATGGLTLLLLSPRKALAFSAEILPYSAIYGVLLCLAQGFYVVALKKGNTSICSLVYSFGFLIPTIFGSIFWNEAFGITKYIGLALAVAALFLTMNTEKQDGVDQGFFPRCFWRRYFPAVWA